MTTHPTTKDPSHEEMVKEHLKALNKTPIFNKPAKETGKVHEVKNIEEILKRTPSS